VVNNIIEKSNNLLDVILSAITRIVDMIVTSFGQVDILNGKFMKAYYAASEKYQAKDNISILNFNYNDAILDNVSAKYTALIKPALNAVAKDINDVEYLKDNSNILNISSSEFFSNMIRELGIPVNNMRTNNELYAYVRDKFRGEKKEMTVSKTQLSMYVKRVTDLKNLSTTIKNNISSFKTSVENIKTRLRSFMSNANINAKDKDILINHIKNAGVILTSYTHFMYYINTLRTEQAISAAYVIRQFYGMIGSK
jgi:hypothetical protein